MKLHRPTTPSFRRDEEAVRKLSPEQFRVTQRSGTAHSTLPTSSAMLS